MADLEQAVGRFVLYSSVLRQVEPERQLYLAVHEEIFADLFEEPIGQLLLANHQIRLVVFDSVTEVIHLWTPEVPTEQ